VKCPKCGFIHYAGPLQCKRCGFRFAASAKEASEPSLSSLFSTDVAPSQLFIEANPAGPLEKTAETSPRLPKSPEAKGVSAPLGAPSEPEQIAEASLAPPWRAELSERVEKFRRRRARTLGADPSAQLDMNFEVVNPKTESAVGAKALESPKPRALEADLGGSLSPPKTFSPDEWLSVEEPMSGSEVLPSAAVQTGEVRLDDRTPESPVEIVLESPRRPSADAVRAFGLDLSPAPLGRRFLAGVVDGAVLLLAAVLFASVFWLTGGQITLRPLNIGILAFIAVFVLLLYFGLFTALTASTPGLLSMGLEVRNLNGSLPTLGQSFRRAFGYLVSLGALMLGFVWALVDSERLTWHDRMSGTFVTDRGLGDSERSGR
jgi:uncharacterized RDD family membrane protein YckC